MFHRVWSSIAASLAIVCLLPLQAPGQTASVTPALSLEELWDSNVTFISSSSESVDSDFITRVSPQVALAKTGKRYTASASYRLDANFHRRRSDLDYVAHSAGLDFRADLTKKTKFNIGDRFDFTKDSLQTSSTGILVVRTDITANTVYLGAVTQVGKATDIGFDASDGFMNFKDPSLIDTRTDSGTITLGHTYGKEARGRVSYTYTNFHFNRASGDRDIDAHTVRLGINERTTPSITLDISVGAAHSAKINKDVIPVANAAFIKEQKDSTMRLIFTRDLTNPTGLAEEVNINDRVGFDWSQILDRRFSFTLYGGLSKSRTEPTGAVDINSYDAGITGSWRPYRWMVVGLGLSHFQQWTKDRLGEGLKRNQIFLNVTFTGGEWRL